MNMIYRSVVHQWANAKSTYEIIDHWPVIGWQAEKQVVSILGTRAISFV
jgi:hypothetical protein